MDDEKYVFFQDVREKKVTGYSARKQRSHCRKGGRVKFPSDYLTKKELKNMSGECKSYRLNEPMKWDEFKAMPDDIQETHLKLLREKYNVSDTQLSKMFGISQGTCNQYLKKKGISRTGNHPGNQAWDKEGFYAWAYGVSKAEECQSVQEEVKDERPTDYVEYTHYELPVKEAEQEDVEEETPVPYVEDTPVEYPIKEQIKKLCDEVIKDSTDVYAIPDTGSMTFTGNATQIMNTLVNLLGNKKVLLGVKWDVVED